MLASLIIPACVALLLITLLIKERYNLMPKQPNKRQSHNQSNKTKREDLLRKENFNRKKYPEDFLDLSGGSMGI